MSLDKFVIFAIAVTIASFIVKRYYRQISKASDYFLLIIMFATFCYGFSSLSYDTETIVCMVVSFLAGMAGVSKFLEKRE